MKVTDVEKIVRDEIDKFVKDSLDKEIKKFSVIIIVNQEMS